MGKNVTLSSDPQESAKHLASSPYRHWEHHCAFDSVQWFTDLGMGFCCSSHHYDCLCRNVYGFYGLKIIYWRSVVNCCIFGLWITLSEPIYDEYTQEVISGISKISGAICSLQRPAPLQKPAKHILACLYPAPQGSYHFTDFTDLFTSQNALCQRGENYKTPNSFKCVWYH